MTTIQKNLMTKFVLLEFASGNLNTKKDVDILILALMNKCKITKRAACLLIREAFSHN